MAISREDIVSRMQALQIQMQELQRYLTEIDRPSLALQRQSQVSQFPEPLPINAIHAAPPIETIHPVSEYGFNQREANMKAEREADERRRKKEEYESMLRIEERQKRHEKSDQHRELSSSLTNVKGEHKDENLPDSWRDRVFDKWMTRQFDYMENLSPDGIYDFSNIPKNSPLVLRHLQLLKDQNRHHMGPLRADFEAARYLERNLGMNNTPPWGQHNRGWWHLDNKEAIDAYLEDLRGQARARGIPIDELPERERISPR